MHNILLVARHEFITNIQKRSFLFAVFGVPLLMGLIFGITLYVQLRANEEGIVAERTGYVEQSMQPVIQDDTEAFVSYPTVGAATEALDSGEIDVFFVITPLYISTGEIRLYSYGAVSDDTRDAIEVFIADNITSSVVTDAPPERLVDPVDFELFIESTQTKLTFESIVGLIITPIIFGVVMLMAIQLSSTFLMSGVVEEKSNHIMEILITSITPYQLLTGKLLGLGALGLLQIIMWIALGLVGVRFSGNVEAFSGIVLPLDYLVTVLVYFILTYFLYSSILAGIGAVIGSEQESRTYAGMVSMLIAIPIFFLSVLVLNPESPIFTVLFFIPFTSGMTYMLKYPFSVIPLWQLAISISTLAVSSLIVTWGAAKVFRWALLLYGKKPSIKTLWAVITGQQEMGVIVGDSPAKEKSA